MSCLKIAIPCFLAMYAFTAQCQTFKAIDKLATPKDMILCINQFGQFVKRFNYDEDFFGNSISTDFQKKMKRDTYLNLLFDCEDSRLDTKSATYSEMYLHLKNEFVQLVNDSSWRINRISDSLYSIVECDVVYRNRAEKMKLILKQQKINRGIAWVIFDVEADFIYDENCSANSSKFIPPTSNEVNYIHLKEFFSKKDSFACYAYKDYKSNRLSIFFQLLYSNEVQYQYVKSIEYCIFDIPGWIVQVKEFKREGENSGWLISDVLRNTEKSADYIKKKIEK